MKAGFVLLALLAVLFVLPVTCSGSREIHASSLKSAYQSARIVKNYIRDDSQRLAFQIAFGTLQQIKTEEGGEAAFLKTVDGKTAEEIIALAREEVNARIAKGDKRFAKYSSWDAMVQQLTQNTPKVLGSEREQRAYE
ncbi:hypothetical protein JCM13664_02210 [Methylothermus subterraneus]